MSNYTPEEIRLTIERTVGNNLLLTECLSVHFEKETYTPYTTMRTTFIYDGEQLENVSAVSLQIGFTVVHKGFVDTLSIMKYPKYNALTITSRGFTSLLGQTEIPEGVLTSPSLDSVFEIVSDLPNITHVPSAYTINYLNVKNHTSAWDVIVNLSLKIYGRYPHIEHVNKIAYTQTYTPKLINPEEDGTLICRGTGLDYSNAVSDLYMLDTTGQYNYHLTESELTSLGIIRRRYLALDKHWLENPIGGLFARLKFGMRGSKYYYVSYHGYNGEDLHDRFSHTNPPVLRICKIVIEGNSKGIVTKLWAYEDRYNFN